MQTFHTCAWNTVEVVQVVINKPEVNSLRGTLGVRWSLVEICEEAGKWNASEQLQNGLDNCKDY